MNNDFQSFIKGLDPKTLADGIKKIQDFSKTAEGKQMIENIKNGQNVKGVNKNDLMKALNENPELLKKINDMLR